LIQPLALLRAQLQTALPFEKESLVHIIDKAEIYLERYTNTVIFVFAWYYKKTTGD